MAKMIGRFKSAPFEEPTVNLTPLIDVVFVILIGFILVAPLLEMDKVELAKAPQDFRNASISVQESSPISIHVRQDNTILFKGAIVTPEELQTRLIEAKKAYPKAEPQLFHDKKAHFGTYQTVKNSLEAAGFEQLEVVLSP